MATDLQRLSAVALLMVVGVVGCGTGEISLVEKAERQIAQHEYDLAEATLTKAIAADPSNNELVLRRGRVRMAISDWEAAEADFSDYIERLPEDMIGYLNRANALEQQGRSDEAERDRDVARTLDPYYSEFNNLYAQLPSSSHATPFEPDTEPSASTYGENEEEVEVEGDEYLADLREDFLSGPSMLNSPSSNNAAGPNRFAGDSAGEESDEPHRPFSRSRSLIDEILARHGGGLESEPLEDATDESNDDLAEAEESGPTPYRWNDYLRNRTSPGAFGQSRTPRSTGLNPRTVPPSGTALPTVPGTGSPTNTTTPHTTGLQSSRGSNYRRPTTTPTPGTNSSPLPARATPRTTGIQSGSRP